MSPIIAGAEKKMYNSGVSAADYDFVRYEPQCIKDEVMALFGQLWPPDREMNDAYFDWKYAATRT